jgi:hypothetical protein
MSRVLFVATMALATRAAADDLPDDAEVIEVTSAPPDEAAPPSYELTTDEIRTLPGAANDALRGVQALPGTARIPFALGGLALRGASPRDTEVVIDGVELPLAFHFGGVSSVVPSELLSSLTMTPGSADASYGRVQGGVVALTTRDPRTDRWRAGGSLGVFDSGAMAEGPLPGHGGLLVGVRRSYLDAVAGPFLGDSYALPAYWDAQIRTAWGDARGAGHIAPMLVGAIDTLDAGDEQLSSAFVRIAAPYRLARGPTTLAVTPWLGWNRLAFTDTTERDYQQHFARPVYRAGLRAELVRDASWGTLRGGTELNATYFSRLQRGFADPDGPQLTDGTASRGWGDAAVFADVAWHIGPITARPGARVEHYGLTGEVVVDPRLSISQRLGAGVTLREAAGRYHQPPLAADLDPTDGNPRLHSSYTDQASLGVDAQLPGHIAASITGFYTLGHDLDVPVGSTPGMLSALDTHGLGPTLQLLLESQLGLASYRENIGRARDVGIELSARRSAGRWFGMVSYTLARAERTDATAFRGWRPFELDQRHNLQLIASTLFDHRRWRTGARLQIVSGDPYTPSATFAAPYSANLPLYASLDIRIDRTWHRCWGDLTAFLDLHNVTDRANVEARGVDPMTGRDVDTLGLPILPFIGVELVPPS